MITIFSVPKSFEGIFKIIQENAIKSWLSLSPKPEIILFGNEKGVEEISKKYSLFHIEEIKTNSNGIPLLSDIFKKAYECAKYKVLCFINADIIINPKLTIILEKILKQYQDFLLIGQRLDVDGIDSLIDTSKNNWFEELLKNYGTKAKLHGPTGIDYFIHKKGLFEYFPNFLIGRTCWDNWAIYYVKDIIKIPVIDLTNVMPIIHQNHPYLTKEGEWFDPWKTKEAEYNYKLAGGYGYCYTIEDADYYMSENFEIIKKRKTLKDIKKIIKRKIQRLKDKFLLK